MRWFRNLALAGKLALSFALLVSLTAGLGVFALKGTQRVNGAADDIGKHWLPSVRFSLGASRAAADYRSSEAMIVVSKDDGDIAGYSAEMDTHQQELDEQLKKLSAT